MPRRPVGGMPVIGGLTGLPCLTTFGQVRMGIERGGDPRVEPPALAGREIGDDGLREQPMSKPVVGAIGVEHLRHDRVADGLEVCVLRSAKHGREEPLVERPRRDGRN